MHALQPKHTKMKPEEAEKLLEKHNISASQLPKISKKDPMVQEFQCETGDIIRIERKTEEGVQEYFRVVV